MSKKLRQFLTISLLLVFITPTAVKLLDDAFHHHVFFHSKVKNSEVWHTFHRTCPIPGFTLSFYTIQKQIHKKEKRTLLCKSLYKFYSRIIFYRIKLLYFITCSSFISQYHIATTKEVVNRIV